MKYELGFLLVGFNQEWQIIIMIKSINLNTENCIQLPGFKFFDIILNFAGERKLRRAGCILCITPRPFIIFSHTEFILKLNGGQSCLFAQSLEGVNKTSH